MNYTLDAFSSAKSSWLPHVRDLTSQHITVGDLAECLYRGMTYDIALPQPWVDSCKEKGLDPRGQCVWIYVHNGFGEPAALTHEFFEAYRREFNIYPVCPKALRK